MLLSARFWVLSFVGLLLLISTDPSFASPAPDIGDGGITLPAGFHATVFADNLGNIRFLAVATNGDVYIKKNSKGAYALRDTTGSGHADVIRSFGDEVGRGTGMAVHGDYVYLSSDDEVFRVRREQDELVPSGKPEVVVTGLPRGQQQHESKVFAFDPDGNLYVEVGCPSNASADKDRAPGATGRDPSDLFKQHGGFWRFKADATNQDQLKDGFHFSSGMRHSVSIAWHPVSKTFYVFMMGRDQLNTVDGQHYTAEYNAENPAEEMHELKEGANFGWPFTYWDPQRHARMLSPEFGGDNRKRDTSGKYPEPLVALPAHWAPLQMAINTNSHFPRKYLNGAFVASHGSWNRGPLPQAGYKVVFLPFYEDGTPTGNYEAFADNFAGVPVINSPGDAHFRPCGLAFGPDGSLYVCDSDKGRVWRIFYDPQATTPKATESVNVKTTSGAGQDTSAKDNKGKQIYTTYCAVCHMPDGSGVANLQPALKTSQRVAGDDLQLLIRILLKGPANVLPADRVHYSNVMPQMDVLTDQQIADVLNYVRGSFAGKAADIKAEDVQKLRGQ